MKLIHLLPAGALLICALANATDVQTVIAAPRRRIETADYRATGHLIRVDAAGKRTSYALSVKGHWFPGVLRTLVEITPSSRTSQYQPVRILLEMHPGGQSMIRIAHPKDSALSVVAFDKWGEDLFGSAFSYEDFLEPQYYWQGQSVVKSVKFGNRDCDVLKSTPGAMDRTHYTQIETWLDHTIGFPIYAEKTLKDGQTIKEFTYLGLRQNGGVWSANQVGVKMRGQSGSSLLIIDRGSTKANLSLKDFSPEQIGHFQDHP